MSYVEASPPGALANVVDCFWRLRHDGPGFGQTIIPDGRPEIVIHLGTQSVKGQTRQRPCLLHGQLGSAMTVRIMQGTDTFGIRLLPWALGEFIDEPASDFAGTSLCLTGIRGGLEEDLMASLREAVTFGGMIKAAAKVLQLYRCEGNARLDRWRRHIARAVILGVRTGGNLDAMRQAWPGSIRHMERMTLAMVGISPRKFANILRFRHAYDMIRHGVCAQTAALKSGYYDLAHLHKDARRFAGLAPADLVGGRSLGPAR